MTGEALPDVLAGMSEDDLDALLERAEADELTDDDQEKVGALTALVNEAFEAMNSIFAGFIGWTFDMRGQSPGTNYRKEPIAGAVLGGTPRNPEDDVVDEIDRLVDWQLKEGRP